MPRKGLDSELVFKAALELIEKHGPEGLTIQQIAKHLGIKPPSLYNHIKSLAMLEQQVSTYANREIVLAMRSAVTGKRRESAIRALGTAYRSFALSHPGLYKISVVFPSRASKEWSTVFLKFRDLFGDVLRDNFDLSEQQVRSSARALRALLHGFIMLELTGGWSDVVDNELSFQASLDTLLVGIEVQETRPKRQKK